MKIRRVIPILLSAFLALSLRAAELNIFAAASLNDALKDVARAYKTSSGAKLRFNFAASSVLAQQIKHGAPADVFFSADEAKMDDLSKAQLIDESTRRSVLSNTLVVVVNADLNSAINSPRDLTKPIVSHIALAEPHSVPAGIYAKEYLQKIDLWAKLSEKIVPTENVRACLAAVEAGNAEAGIVYKTDALLSRRVKIAYEVSRADGPKISYPLAVLKDSENAADAKKFVEFLNSAEARDVFSKYGFLPAP